MVHDEVYPLYQAKDRWEGRAGTDGRNSESRPMKWFEKAEEIYNNETVTFDTLVLGDLHQDFKESYHLDKTNTPATNAETIKKKAASARAEILCVIDKWERSGNGSGQRGEEDNEYGSILRDGGQQWLRPGSTMDEPEFQDGDNRANFLNGRGSHILYLWELFDRHQMLQSTILALPASVGADSESVPSVANRGRPKKATSNEKGRKEHNLHQHKISASLEKLATQSEKTTLIQLNKLYNQMVKEVRRARLDMLNCPDDDLKNELKEELEEYKTRQDKLLEQIKKEEEMIKQQEEEDAVDSSAQDD